MLFVFYFFFFKQKTAYEMRISDWSSDVCSSDLVDDPGTDRSDGDCGRESAPCTRRADSGRRTDINHRLAADGTSAGSMGLAHDDIDLCRAHADRKSVE